jgi:peptide deformylase
MIGQNELLCYNCFVLKIVTAPNPILLSIAKPVPIKSGQIAKIDASVIKIIEEMKEALVNTVDPKGVGLAAPQVGKPLRIFIAKPTDNSKVLVFINPEIIEQSSELNYVKRPARRLVRRSTSGSESTSEGELRRNTSKKDSEKLEGCLSLPTIWGPVLRATSLTLSYLDERGKHHKEEFKSFLATIIQHETDHLNGILFPKRVLEQKGILYKSRKNEKGQDEFEEIEL